MTKRKTKHMGCRASFTPSPKRIEAMKAALKRRHLREKAEEEPPENDDEFIQTGCRGLSPRCVPTKVRF